MEKEPKSVVVKISCTICLSTEGSPSPWSLTTITGEGIAIRMKEQHIEEFGHAESIQIVTIEEDSK